jgi:hypothetical protein
MATVVDKSNVQGRAGIPSPAHDGGAARAVQELIPEPGGQASVLRSDVSSSRIWTVRRKFVIYCWECVVLPADSRLTMDSCHLRC